MAQNKSNFETKQNKKKDQNGVKLMSKNSEGTLNLNLNKQILVWLNLKYEHEIIR